ncbi:Na+/H+ antiporter [Arthrobacter woluwensis]|uniref:Na+/H+ antiporter n=1 Tax=Arthrobacter woluwensis TaxID=156980 RepID=UPI001AAF4A99|nr:Na+/H+ antiporter [Arthrobacter woluwensis]QTF72359.1 Na+/H+ antiporter [Arthrobacter woluwensis]
MEQLALIVGLLFATVLAVGLGDRLKLPYPVLMLLMAMVMTFIPGFPELAIDPELILPVFLPPLLFATAQRSSWQVFQLRWRTLLWLAVGLVVVTTVFVAGAAWLLIPGIGIPAAIALGAMVAPPDPVAVESVAGKVHMPRKLMNILQSEGLFNDAAAIVIFQAAVAATLAGRNLDASLVPKFLLGIVLAVIIGVVMGYAAKLVTWLVTAGVARTAVSLVVPFAAYILAEEAHASGVIAVVVVALEMKRHARPEDASERVSQAAFWDVVELLATGLAFGLVGLDIRQVIHHEGAGIFAMVPAAIAVCAVVVVVRFLWTWLYLSTRRSLYRGDWVGMLKDVIILSYSGMRGLATLALALALPLVLDDGSAFPARDQILVTACAVLLVTLVLPGLTLPALMKVLKAQDDGAEEKEATRMLGRRAQKAAMLALKESELVNQLTPEQQALMAKRFKSLHLELQGADPEHPGKGLPDDARERFAKGRELMVAAQTIALDAARQEVLVARKELGMDPEVADHVLRQLDLRTMVMPKTD